MKSSNAIRGLPGALLLALAACALYAWWMLSGSAEHSSANLVRTAIAQTRLADTPVLWQLAGFGGALLLLHLAVGVAGWLLALATSSAWPALRARQRWTAPAWTLALFLCADLANAVLFPWTFSAGGWSGLARFGVGPINVFTFVAALLLAVAATTLWRSLLASNLYARHGARVLVYPALALGVALTWSIHNAVAVSGPEGAQTRPHVIIIGIDSLRPDAVGASGAIGVTPNLDEFLAEASVFDDAITPLARTFPSWVTILTGRHPVDTRVRENLVPRNAMAVQSTLADTLRAEGYRTVYATDEVRFSNIDHSFGFDDVVGPSMGASDFLVGSLNDTPLSNLAANSFLGEALLPFVHNNRAAATTYRPERFIAEVAANVDFREPTLLALHLTLPHWPYHWAEDNAGSLGEAQRQPYTYTAALIEADRQFGMLMRHLERKGALHNAIVVVLSDHGEALGMPADSLLRSAESKRVTRGLPVNIWGHGTSVLSPVQYSVLLAFRGFGRSLLAAGSADFTQPVSLEDITPTILELTKSRARPPVEGVSLAGLLNEVDGAETALSDRLRFTESGVTLGFKQGGEPELQDMLTQGLQIYDVNPATGRVEMKPDYLPKLLAVKERAVISKDRILAAIPDGGSTWVVAVDRDGTDAQLLTSAPGAEDPELARMWEGLRARYGDELAATRFRASSPGT